MHDFKKNKKTRVIFLDSDLAQLFADLRETTRTAVQSAIFIQVIDRLIRQQPDRKKKSVVITVPDLQREWFPFWSMETTKRILQRLRRLGIIKTQIIHKNIEHATRIWIQEKRILELAEQVRNEVEVVESAKKINKEK